LTTRSQTVNHPLPTTSTFGASFKAGVVGGFAISLLLVVRELVLSHPLIHIGLIFPAIGLVWLVTGIGAAMLCDDRIETGKEGARVGLVAGIVAGVLGGITAMIIAALGRFLQDYGQGTLSQLSDTNLQTLYQWGFTDELISLSGSIITAMFACGLGGMVIAGLLGRLGGWLYTKFS